MQVCSTNGLRSIFKFSEILGSTMYAKPLIAAQYIQPKIPLYTDCCVRLMYGSLPFTDI